MPAVFEWPTVPPRPPVASAFWRAARLHCPACGGGLFQINEGPVPRYRCRVGHAWSPETLLDEQAVALEGALWMALRALEEKSELSRRMADSSAHRRAGTGLRFRAIAADAAAAGATIRRLIERLGSMPEHGVDTTLPGDPDELSPDVR